MKNLTFIYFSLCVCLSFFWVVKVQNQNLDSYFLTLFSTMSTAWRNYLQKLFHFKKRTQHHQTILLSNEAECSQSRATENWSRKYSTERHYLYLHNHSLCRWKKTYILYAYMKPWEHLITLTAVKSKEWNSQCPFFDVHQAMEQGPLNAGIRKSFRLQKLQGAPARLWVLSEKWNKEQGQRQEKARRVHAPTVDNCQQ